MQFKFVNTKKDTLLPRPKHLSKVKMELGVRHEHTKLPFPIWSPKVDNLHSILPSAWSIVSPSTTSFLAPNHGNPWGIYDSNIRFASTILFKHNQQMQWCNLLHCNGVLVWKHNLQRLIFTSHIMPKYFTIAISHPNQYEIMKSFPTS